MAVIVKSIVLDLVKTANVRDAGGLSGASMPISPTKIADAMEWQLNEGIHPQAQLVHLQLVGESMGQMRFLAIYNISGVLVRGELPDETDEDSD